MYKSCKPENNGSHGPRMKLRHVGLLWEKSACGGPTTKPTAEHQNNLDAYNYFSLSLTNE